MYMVKQFAVLLSCIACMYASGCATFKKNSLVDRIAPSNYREWSPSLAKAPKATIIANKASIRNVRHCSYLSDDDYTVSYAERQYDLDQLISVDFLVVPFQNNSLIAHTMLSFGFDNGEHVCVSAEIRTEKDEEYSSWLGFVRQYELCYVVGDERDLIPLRTEHRDAEVYVYPTTATPEQARSLFFDVMRRVNKLAQSPEFYHTLTNNCTINIARHVNQLRPNRVPYSLSVLLPGLAPRYAYQLGLLDQSLPFEELQARAKVNDYVVEFLNDPDFSRQIRKQTRIAAWGDSEPNERNR